ncbi:MAG: apolipoprotein N-acyltransferase [Bdellovibrionota bacterium]|nr:apolipoprotein N-acyltransferase [Bdellovibrionota bacterium]
MSKNHIIPNMALGLLGSLLYSAAHPSRLPIEPLGPLSVIIGLFLIVMAVFNYEKKSWPIIFTNHLFLYFLSLDWLASSLQLLTPIPYFFCYIICFFWTFLLVPTLWFPLLLKYNRGLPYLKEYPLLKNILIPSTLFCFLETFLSFNLEIFIGSSWILYPQLAEKASIFGPKYFSFINFCFALLLVEIARSKPLTKSSPELKKYFFFFIFLFLPLTIPDTRKSEKTAETEINARVVQPNSSNRRRMAGEKGRKNVIEKILNELIYFSTKPTLRRELDLIVWPEVAYPYALELNANKTGLNEELPYTLARYVSRTNTPLLFGGYIKNNHVTSEYQDTYNSALYLGPQGNLKQHYSKHVFVPFGEQVPLIGHFKATQKYFSNTSYFAIGERTPVFEGPKEGNFITVMCFEVIFTSFIRNYLEKTKENNPAYIINLTNDSWLLNSAGPKHHLFLARWRAVEFDLPIIRANNSGVSTIIYPDSSLGKSIPFDKSGIIDFNFKIKKNRIPTLYQEYGNLPFLLYALLFILLSLIPLPANSFLRKKDYLV